jgi:hypothetical protein
VARQLETPEASELSGSGSRLDTPGTYHFIVEDIQDGKQAGDSFLNGLFAKLKVLHGEQKDQVFNLDLLDPTMNSKDGGAFARKKQAAFLIATNVLTPEQANGQTVSYEEQDARGAQCIAEVRFGKDRDGNISKYLDLHFSNIYHIDDPRVAKVEKDEASLTVIDPKHRHDAAYFESMMGQRKQGSSPAPKTAEPDFGGL